MQKSRGGCFSNSSQKRTSGYEIRELSSRITGRLTFQWLAYILVGMVMVRKSARRRAPRLRDPERTRERLLQAAFREVYRVGFQSAGIDAILAATNVTKGALYYHFENKEALGHAVIEEVVAKLPRERWLLPLQRSEDKDPIDALIGIVRAIPSRPRDVKGGCPLVHLAQEMSQLDEQFRKRLERIFHAWQEGIAVALRRGRSEGSVRRDLDPEETASFLIAMIEGYEVLAKNAQDAKVWNMGIRNIVGWLNSLRAPGNRKRG
jgi:TetR/AcrR family transcriptional regulator, transcriptional repressor for nem operon